ncbi:MAG TPA: hypothetical protein VK647_15555, partial [Gemmatimonadales bacterium]|nr:hypothetical protein [Gemmatimonadales bacterium]
RDDRPLQLWKYRRLPFRALVTIQQRATTLGVQETIDSGAQNIKQKANVHGGGTAGVTPIPQTTPVIQFIGEAGDELIVSNDEILAGTPTVDGYCNVEPV